uniref:Uncharacterized protein n=1 Tax=Myripristis murdjan TaxID=586833 RepID=A0A667ZR98_9TELE
MQYFTNAWGLPKRFTTTVLIQIKFQQSSAKNGANTQIKFSELQRILTTGASTTPLDLTKLNEMDKSLQRAKGKMAAGELDRKLAELNDVAKSQEEMIGDYDRQIREIRADIAILNDIKNTLPDGCFNTPSLERP